MSSNKQARPVVSFIRTFYDYLLILYIYARVFGLLNDLIVISLIGFELVIDINGCLLGRDVPGQFRKLESGEMAKRRRALVEFFSFKLLVINKKNT